MKTNLPPLPQIFKGIALFTPGGDLIYCIDAQKKSRWHLHLALGLQEILGLTEPPHFLIPTYTATVDRCREPHWRQILTYGEIHARVRRYQPLLNVIFGTEDSIWKAADWGEESSSPMVLESYRQQFPQLWDCHELIVHYDVNKPITVKSEQVLGDAPEIDVVDKPQGYVLRLFVAGNNSTTKQTLETIHQLLEQDLGQPYTLKVVDISKDPEQAELNHVSAVPTLIRVCPPPVRRIVGELNDLSRLLQLISVG